MATKQDVLDAVKTLNDALDAAATREAGEDANAFTQAEVDDIKTALDTAKGKADAIDAAPVAPADGGNG